MLARVHIGARPIHQRITACTYRGKGACVVLIPSLIVALLFVGAASVLAIDLFHKSHEPWLELDRPRLPLGCTGYLWDGRIYHEEPICMCPCHNNQPTM